MGVYSGIAHGVGSVLEFFGLKRGGKAKLLASKIKKVEAVVKRAKAKLNKERKVQKKLK